VSSAHELGSPVGVPVTHPAAGAAALHGLRLWGAPRRLNPEPAKLIFVVTAAGLGANTMRGVTVNNASAESPPGVPVTVTPTPPPTYTEFAPTLNLPESWPDVLTVHVSPLVSTISEAAPEVIVQPVSAGEARKPVPVTVTSVADAVGGPVIGGDPLVGLNVTAEVTVKTAATLLSPWTPVTTILKLPPGAALETMKPVVGVSTPRASMEQKYPEKRFAGVEVMVQGP